MYVYVCICMYVCMYVLLGRFFRKKVTRQGKPGICMQGAGSKPEQVSKGKGAAGSGPDLLRKQSETAEGRPNFAAKAVTSGFD
jgi:hypothetical protein